MGCKRLLLSILHPQYLETNLRSFGDVIQSDKKKIMTTLQRFYNVVSDVLLLGIKSMKRTCSCKCECQMFFVIMKLCSTRCLITGRIYVKNNANNSPDFAISKSNS